MCRSNFLPNNKEAVKDHVSLEHYKSKLPCRPGLACQSNLPRFSFVCRSKFLPNSEEALKDHVSLKCHKSKLPCQSGLACQSRLPR